MEWLHLLAVQGTLKSLLQHHSSKASIFRHSAFFTVQFSHPYMTTWKTIAMTRWTFVGKVMSLLFNMLSRLVITFLPRTKRLLISWLMVMRVFWGILMLQNSVYWNTALEPVTERKKVNPELWWWAVTPVQQRLLDTNESKFRLNETHPTQPFRCRTDSHLPMSSQSILPSS